MNFDEFGMDRNYIESLSRSVFKFLCDRYWRTSHAQGRLIVARHGSAH